MSFQFNTAAVRQRIQSEIQRLTKLDGALGQIEDLCFEGRSSLKAVLRTKQPKNRTNIRLQSKEASEIAQTGNGSKSYSDVCIGLLKEKGMQTTRGMVDLMSNAGKPIQGKRPVVTMYAILSRLVKNKMAFRRGNRWGLTKKAA